MHNADGDHDAAIYCVDKWGLFCCVYKLELGMHLSLMNRGKKGFDGFILNLHKPM